MSRHPEAGTVPGFLAAKGSWAIDRQQDSCSGKGDQRTWFIPHHIP